MVTTTNNVLFSWEDKKKPSARPGNCETYLGAADVETISGLSCIKRIPLSRSRYFKNDLHFVRPDGQEVLIVEFSKSAHFNTYKTAVPKNCKFNVEGLGEEAFMGPDISNQAPFILVFRKGTHCVSLNVATTNDARENMLTIEQLISLGKIIESRLS